MRLLAMALTAVPILVSLVGSSAGSPNGLPDQTLIHPGALTLLGRTQ
jgi:hypothetical protein